MDQQQPVASWLMDTEIREIMQDPNLAARLCRNWIIRVRCSSRVKFAAVVKVLSDG